MTDLDEIKAALAAAPPRPFYVRSERRRIGIVDRDDRTVALVEHVHVGLLHLFALAPTWLAELCDRVERAEADLDIEEERKERAQARAEAAERECERLRAAIGRALSKYDTCEETHPESCLCGAYLWPYTLREALAAAGGAEP